MSNELLAAGIVAVLICVAWALWPRRRAIGADQPQHPPVKPAPLTPAQRKRVDERAGKKRLVLQLRDPYPEAEGRPEGHDPERWT